MFNWRCQTCDRSFAVCEKCGTSYSAPQSPLCRDRHEAPTTYHPFIAYFDFALGEQVDSLAQRKRFMRNKHMDYRDKMSPGALSARRDRLEQQKREQARG